MVAGLWPSVPLHAVATDKIDTFSMATGMVDVDYEAVYFLDHLTGDLYAYVIGRTANGFGVIQRSFRNVLQDFKTEGDKTPKFIMATCLCDLNRSGRGGGSAMPSRAVLYVADVASGMTAVYALPFSTTQHNTGRYAETPLALICGFPIRKVLATPKKGKASDAF